MKIDGELDFTKIPIPPTTEREREKQFSPEALI
jgi:hypothetical protein